jgi:hypothetical protein
LQWIVSYGMPDRHRKKCRDERAHLSPASSAG